VVTDVDPSSPAATTGLSRGDVIQEVNHKPVHNVEEYNQAISSSGKKPVLLLINKGGRTNFIVVEPTQ
jgi:S1-C subfamily serine protease